MVKKCCMCKEELPVEQFKKNSRRKDGLQSQCIECQREYRRKHYEANKEKYIDKAAVWKAEFIQWWKEYKKQFRCQNCGEDHPACIHFHHPNNNKEKAVSIWVRDACKQQAMKEIERCVPLCANCHAKVHWEE